MTYFRKEVDGRLTGQQMRDTRIELGLTQVQAAAIFGGGPNSFAKYEADDVTQSEAMDNLVRLASEVPAAKQWLFSKASVKELHKAAEQTLEQQFYNINIGMIFGSRTAPRLPWVMSSLESSTYNSSLRSQIEKRLIPYHQSVELGATQTAVHVVAGVVERKIRLYGEEENIQSLLSPRYSEEEYDRHTRR
jgi:transcriptional regulator with XRE-family HTH domain